MIEDFHAVLELIHQIHQRYEQVDNNRGYARSLKNRVTILTNVLKQIEDFPDAEQEKCKETLQQIKLIFEKSLSFIDTYLQETSWQNILNMAQAYRSWNDFMQLSEDISKANDDLLTNITITEANAVRNQLLDMRLFQEAILEETARLKTIILHKALRGEDVDNASDTQEILQLDGTSPVIQENFQNLRLKLKPMFSQHYKFINEYANKKNPMDYNSDRDALLATSVGQQLSRDEIDTVERLINEKAAKPLRNFLNEKAEKFHINLDEELIKYFQECYDLPATNRRGNLITVIDRAIEQARDGSIQKYKNEEVECFIGKMFGLYSEKVNFPSVYGEILSCEKENDFIFIIRDKKISERCKIVVTENNEKWSVVLYKQTQVSANEYFRFQSENTCHQDSLFFVSCDDSMHKMLGLEKEKYFLEKSGSASETHIVLKKNGKVFRFTLSNAKNEASFESPDQKNKTIKKKEFLKWFNQQEIILEGKLAETASVASSMIQIKPKQLDANEVKWEKQEKIERLKNVILLQLNEVENLIFLDDFLDRLIKNNFQNLSKEDAFVTNWIDLLPKSISQNINDLFSTYLDLMKNLLDKQKKDKNDLLVELVLDANCTRFMKTQEDATKNFNIMMRLAESSKYLKEIKESANLIMFLGESGAGKSTLVNYFSGVDLEMDTKGAIPRVVIKDESAQESDYAKIGLFMTISETMHVRNYAVKKRDWDNASEIDFNNLLLSDCPGFNDTRGEDYDLSGAISISRTIKQANSIKAVVLVIPFYHFYGKGTEVVRAFNKLEKLLADGIKNPSVKKSIRVIINHNDDHQKNQETLKTLIKDFCAESASQNTKQQYIWQFFKTLLFDENGRRILFASIENNDASKQWLSPCAKTEYQNELKREFLDLLELPWLQQQYADCIQGSIYTWQRLVLMRYLKDIPDKIKEFNGLIQKNKEDIVRLSTQNNAFEKEKAEFESQKVLKEQERFALKELLEKIRKGEISLSDSQMDDHRKKIKELKSQDLEQKKQQLERVRKNIEEEVLVQQQEKIELQKQTDEIIADILSKIRHLEDEKTMLSEGNATDVLEEQYRIKGTGVLKHREIDPETFVLRFGNFKEGSWEAARAVPRELEKTDYIENETKIKEEVLAKEYTGTVRTYEHIKKGYEIVPPEERVSFYAMKEVKSADGNFKATLEGNNTWLSSTYIPNAADDGKSMAYIVYTKWKKGEPFPWYSIVHTLPNKVVNKEAISKCSSDIILLNSQLVEEEERKTKMEEALKQITGKIEGFQKEKEKLLKEIEEKQLTDNIEAWVQDYDTIIERIRDNIQTKIAYIQKNKTQICEADSEIKKMEMDIKKLNAYKVRLAVVIKSKWSLLTSLKEYAEDACRDDTDLASALRKRGKMSRGLKQVENESLHYTNYYNEIKDSVLLECQRDFQSLSLVQLREGVVDFDRELALFPEDNTNKTSRNNRGLEENANLEEIYSGNDSAKKYSELSSPKEVSGSSNDNRKKPGFVFNFFGSSHSPQVTESIMHNQEDMNDKNLVLAEESFLTDDERSLTISREKLDEILNAYSEHRAPRSGLSFVVSYVYRPDSETVQKLRSLLNQGKKEFSLAEIRIVTKKYINDSGSGTKYVRDELSKAFRPIKLSAAQNNRVVATTSSSS